MHPPIFLYYRLTKFYQNHRRYVKSVDQDQLQGKFRDNDTIAKSDCDPLKTRNVTGVTKAVYPCGLVANSLFNDTFSSPVLQNSVNSSTNTQTYPMTNRSIAWSSDGDIFKKTVYTNDQVIPPQNWLLRYPNGTYNDQYPIPDIHTWEEFHNWMRTAGLPTFAKLALRNDHDILRAGTYQINITDGQYASHILQIQEANDLLPDFPVNEYGGTKSIMLSTRTVLGGKNPFLGIAYVVIGGVCLILGLAFLAMHLVKPRKLGDHSYLSWNNDQPSTATTTPQHNETVSNLHRWFGHEGVLCQGHKSRKAIILSNSDGTEHSKRNIRSPAFLIAKRDALPV